MKYKKCPKCKEEMIPEEFEAGRGSQSDETTVVYVWYCRKCKQDFDMDEDRQIECFAHDHPQQMRDSEECGNYGEDC